MNKRKKSDELIIANKELVFQTEEKEKRKTESIELEALNYSLKLASQYSLSLIEASRDPLFTISPEGKITDMNQATVKVTGESREKLIGTDFFDYFTKPDKAREGCQHVFAKGFVADFPLTIMDGKLTDVLFNGSVYKDGGGNVLGAVLVASEIIEKKYNMEDLNKLKILLVEDNYLNVLLILSLFSENNLKLQVAENGFVCIEKLKENNGSTLLTTDFDIILMDMEMPVMNGYEATSIIRKELKNNIPIIAMTAHVMAGERERCLSLGMNDYISKPIDANLLFEKMSQLT